MTGRRSSIYALCDPGTGAVRYIGKTVVALSVRLSQHLSRARKGKRTHLHCWLRSLTSPPTIRALEVVPYESDSQAEMLAIAKHRAEGCLLTNATDGGEGKKGCAHSEESKAKIRAANIGRKMPPKSPETLRRMADAQRGKKLTPEHRAKIAASGLGRIATQETRAKLRAAVRGGWKLSAETRSKMSAARTGAKRGPMSDAQRAKLAIANTGRTKSPETIEKHAAQLRGRKHTTEAIQKMREARRAYWARKRAV